MDFPIALTDAGQYEMRVWLVAEQLYRHDHPRAGRLVYAGHAVRSGYVRKALAAVIALTEGVGPQRALQAAADFASHRAYVIKRATLHGYNVTGGQA